MDPNMGNVESDENNISDGKQLLADAQVAQDV